MSTAVVLLAPGFEEIEAISVIDVLRRGGVEVTIASITDDLEVKGSHQITILADVLLREIQDDRNYDAVITPGGQPGSDNLAEDPIVLELLRDSLANNRIVASICASPIVLEAAGLSRGRAGTSFPSVKDQVNFADYKEDLVVQDGKLITSRGPATALLFALIIVKELEGDACYETLREALLIPLLRDQIQDY